MKKRNTLIFGIYCSALLIQNILALKTIDIVGFTVTTGILISPVVFILQDVESEIYGFHKTKQMILLAYFMNFIFTLLIGIAILIPPAPFYANQGAFATLFATTPRIVIASFLAYCIGSLTNSKIMTLNKEKYGLFRRAITSTIAGQILDNAIFAFIAFYGSMPVNLIFKMVIGATIIESLYEIVFYPVTKKIINYLKQ
ncbi:queuosine precursor transporter [Thomasclavelia cocleata]|uniref:queuosine precursor transporter n=1 Tax=Thomasclavelia cocleata TaxID=69824 RepID=UPI00242F7C3D|nr:queuosine precursor transporter [Thomasclavelia cocleata]